MCICLVILMQKWYKTRFLNVEFTLNMECVFYMDGVSHHGVVDKPLTLYPGALVQSLDLPVCRMRLKAVAPTSPTY